MQKKAKNINFNNLAELETSKEIIDKTTMNKKVVIIETELTRIDSSFFSNAISVKRVLCPIILSEEIKKKIFEYLDENIDKKNLLIVSLKSQSIEVSEKLNNMGFETISIESVDYDIKDSNELKETTEKILKMKETEEYCDFRELIKLIY